MTDVTYMGFVHGTMGERDVRARNGERLFRSARH